MRNLPRVVVVEGVLAGGVGAGGGDTPETPDSSGWQMKYAYSSDRKGLVEWLQED